ncbi:MAG: PASTA domain-containing protein [bacterium]
MARPSTSKIIKFLTILFFLGFSLSLCGWMLWTVYDTFFRVPQEVRVPRLIGKSRLQAEQVLKPLGLILSIKENVYKDDSPPDTVIAQEPAPERSVRQGREILVSISIGPEMRDIPSLKGKTLREARVSLTNCKFKLGKTTMEMDDRFPAGSVIAQSPEPGRKARRGTPVNLVINKGRNIPVVVPNYVGKDFNEIRETFSSQRLVLGAVTWMWQEEVPRGQIIEQSPESGKSVPLGTSVNFKASAGPPWGGTVLKQQTITYEMPPGKGSGVLKVVLNDDFGISTLYQAHHTEGEEVELLVSGFGDSEVVIYIDNSVVKRFRI